MCCLLHCPLLRNKYNNCFCASNGVCIYKFHNLSTWDTNYGSRNVINRQGKIALRKLKDSRNVECKWNLGNDQKFY